MGGHPNDGMKLVPKETLCHATSPTCSSEETYIKNKRHILGDCRYPMEASDGRNGNETFRVHLHGRKHIPYALEITHLVPALEKSQLDLVRLHRR